MNCKHGIEKAWCSICKDLVEVVSEDLESGMEEFIEVEEVFNDSLNEAEMAERSKDENEKDEGRGSDSEKGKLREVDGSRKDSEVG